MLTSVDFHFSFLVDSHRINMIEWQGIAMVFIRVLL